MPPRPRRMCPIPRLVSRCSPTQVSEHPEYPQSTRARARSIARFSPARLRTAEPQPAFCPAESPSLPFLQPLPVAHAGQWALKGMSLTSVVGVLFVGASVGVLFVGDADGAGVVGAGVVGADVGPKGV